MPALETFAWLRKSLPERRRERGFSRLNPRAHRCAFLCLGLGVATGKRW